MEANRSELVQKRVEELRQKKYEEEKERAERIRKLEEKQKQFLIQLEKEKQENLINAEAEAIIYFEKINPENIINGFTDDKKIVPYIESFYGLGKFNVESLLPRNIICGTHKEKIYSCRECKTEIDIAKKRDAIVHRYKIIHDHIYNLIQPIQKERDERRKHEEYLTEQQQKQSDINSINKYINQTTLSDATSHTYTQLTLEDWDICHGREFLTNKDGIWCHWKINRYENKSEICYINSSIFINYFEEQKVPFCTTCPTCKSPTKFNYLHRFYNNPYGGGNSEYSSCFSEVYCDGHYWYDSSRNTHYIANLDGLIIENPTRQNIGSWGYKCWNPKGYFQSNGYRADVYIGTKWKQWDPQDPDGKKAECVKKQKEVDEIQKQIEELQKRLTTLN